MPTGSSRTIDRTAFEDARWGVSDWTTAADQDLDPSVRSTQVREFMTFCIEIIVQLRRLLEEISTFAQKEASCGFLKLLFTKDQRIARIESYYRRIGISIESFQASCSVFESTTLVDIDKNNRSPHY
jgi:hypothetical protein